MIKEDYVSFETAKLLKEKGFNEDSWFHYDTDGYIVMRGYRLNMPEDIPAWTLQIAMKWLREVHNIHINIDIHWLFFANQNGWMYIITKILENGTDYIYSNGDENDKHFYSSYKEACESAIKYCLENLI